MDSFDYDCFASVDKFCNNDLLDQEMKKASQAAPIDLSAFNDSTEDILITGTVKGSNEEFYTIGENDEPVGAVSTSPRRLRKTTKNARLNGSDIVDLTSIEVSVPKKKRKKINNDVIDVDLDDTWERVYTDCIRNDSILSDSDPDNLTINVQWDSKIEKVSHRKYQKFSELMEVFSKREDCSINDILFNMDNRVISPDDTPHSINYKFYDIICGRVVPNCNKVVTDSMKASKEKNKNIILLKIQSSNWKKPLEISVEKNEKFSILVAKLAEELKLKAGDFTLIFDGEKLDMTETPTDLDFDGGELIDCKIKAESNQLNTENAVTSKRKAPVRKSKRKCRN